MSTTPRRLASLLSRLPSNGLHAIVRPHNYPPSSFYIITRSKLSFKPRFPAKSAGSSSGASSSAAASASASTSTSTSSATPKQEEDDGDLVGEAVEAAEAAEAAASASAWPEIGKLQPRGKVWALPYWNGRYAPPQRKTKAPAPLIPRSLMRVAWVPVEPASLPPAAQAAISEWKTTMAQRSQVRDEAVEHAKAKARAGKAELADKWKRVEAYRRDKRAAAKTVTILY